MKLKYITRINKDGELWTPINNSIIESKSIKLVDKVTMGVCLNNSDNFNMNIKSLRRRSGMGKTKLINSKNRLASQGYIKHTQSKMKIWKLFVDETGTSTFRKFIHRSEEGKFTRISNTLFEKLESKALKTEEFGIMLLLLRNKDTHMITYKQLEKKTKLHRDTFAKYFNKLEVRGFVAKNSNGIVFTDEEGKGNFHPMSPFQKRELLIHAMNQPIKFKDDQERLLVEKISALPRKEWGELDEALYEKVAINYLKNASISLVA